jgi:hypothetical protein
MPARGRCKLQRRIPPRAAAGTRGMPERADTMCQSPSSTSARHASSVSSVLLTSWHSARSTSRWVPCAARHSTGNEAASLRRAWRGTGPRKQRDAAAAPLAEGKVEAMPQPMRSHECGAHVCHARLHHQPFLADLERRNGDRADCSGCAAAPALAACRPLVLPMRRDDCPAARLGGEGEGALAWRRCVGWGGRQR